MIIAALIGNPNSGKTTVFNKLTGSIQRVGNWPGVTVERKQGFVRGSTEDKILVVDLPGIYSLSPYSPDEVVSRDYLIGNSTEKPDVAVNILDASNIERGLYLLTQVADLGIPMVVVLNMMDVADKSGMKIDAKLLSETLGCEVIETVGVKSRGMTNVAEAIQNAYDRKTAPKKISYGCEVEDCISAIGKVLDGKVRSGLERWVALKLIERDDMVCSDLDKEDVDRALAIVSDMEKKVGDDGVQIIASSRYGAGSRIQSECLVKRKEAVSGNRLSDKIDRILLNRVAAIPIFIVVMYIVYWISIQTVGTPCSDFINDGFVVWIQHNLTVFMTEAGVEPALTDFVIDGIVAGVGAVLGFLPLIIILMFCLVLLEECGYMVRIAYVLDRIFVHFGLSGKAVIPAVIGIGCGVPAIMGTRTIEDESNRNISVICTTFMPCSAKLPILTVIISAFFGGSALVTLCMYLLGIVMILLSGIVLKKFSGYVGKPAPFVMELPVYHVPAGRNVVTSVTEKSWAFCRKAFTLILLSAVIIWLLSSFNWRFEYLGSGCTSDSILACIGSALAPIFIPCGFGEKWELAVATITGLMAKENLLAITAVLIDAAVDGDDIITADALAVFCTSGVAMAFLIFNLLCAPCFAAIGAMHRELVTWKKTLLAVLYQCATAYAVATIYYQIWLLTVGTVSPWIFLAVLFVAFPVYMAVSKAPFAFVRQKLAKPAEGVQ